ncbi:MAG: hypothetical protein RLN90_01270 [Balneolaceae bacterium]
MKESTEVVELKLSESNIELATKANSYNGFGLYVQGDIINSVADTRIDLSITIRHDFRLFNLIFGIALLIALFYDKVQINGQVMEFEDRVPYILLGFLILVVFDLIFLTIPWIRLKRHLSKKLNLKK